MSTELKFTRGESKNLNATSIIDGQFLYCTDTGDIYIDTQTVRKKANSKSGLFYIEGTGTNDSTAKVSSWTGSHPDITDYYPGLTILYKVGVAGNTTTTLNINTLGAVKVVRNATTNISTAYPAKSVVLLVYTVDGSTAYWKTFDYDSNTKNTTGTANKTGATMYLVGSASQNNEGATTYTNSNIYINTENQIESIKGFKGDLIGNADTATKATQDGSGNTITSTYATKTAATQSAAGLMSADDKTKLDGIATGANKYSLPNATSSTLGGVKIGSNITVSSGTISLTKADVTSALGYTPPTTNTTYSAAGSSLGLVKTGGNVSISDGVITVNDDGHNHVISNVDGLQDELTAKQATITGAATTVTSSNLTASRVLVSNSSGKIAVSSNITTTELGHLNGVTGNVQTQLDDKYSSTTSRTKNTVLAAPNGSDGAATFRALVAADIPSLSASKITSGTLTAARLPTSGATAGSYGPSANATLSHDGTFTVPYVTVDTYGRVTGISNITYTLPSDSNTDTKVTQTVRTTDGEFPILLRGTSAGTTTTTTTTTFASAITINPSKSTITAGTFNGALKGNTDNRSVATTPNDYNSIFKIAGLKSNSSIGSPSTDSYSGVIGFRQWSDNSGGKAHELAFNDSGLFMRQGASTSWEAWEKFITSGNYTSYTVKKDGTGASGSWGINVTGNAASATKLATARTIALGGNLSGSISFDGSANKDFNAKLGKEWTAITTVNAYSRLCKLSGYSNWILSVQLGQSSQVSYNVFLVSLGYECASITQLGGTGYTTNSEQTVRLARAAATTAYVELLNTYGYDGATTVSCSCKLIPLSTSADLATQTFYTEYSAGASSPTVFSTITTSGYGITAHRFAGNLSGNASSATKLQTARNINGVSFDGTSDVTVYSPRETFQFQQSLKTNQWYRLAKVSNAHGFSCRLQISSTYHYNLPMSATFEISATYGNYQKVTQISGGGNVAMLPKIRLVRKLDSEWYIEAYYNGSTSGNTFSFNFSSISPVSSLTNSFGTGSIPSGYTATEFELLPNAGKTSVTGSGAISVAVENDTEYRYTNVSTLNITYPSSGNFECWLKVTFSSSGTHTITFPSGTTYIGASLTSGVNSATYEISIKDKVAIIKKVG